MPDEECYTFYEGYEDDYDFCNSSLDSEVQDKLEETSFIHI